MNPTAQATAATTRLDIGLSKEDQARIESLRQVSLDKKKSKGPGGNPLARLNELLVSFTRIRLQEKVTFFQLLAVMINSGVPIIRSLYVLSDQNTNPRFKVVIRHLAKEMEQGKSLSDAMQHYKKVFTEAERGMIASGEASGNLNDILKDIAKQAEKSAHILSKVKGAMIYPAAIFSILMVALFLMLTMVVPKLTELFTESGSALPWTTDLLIRASEWAQSYWYLALIMIIALIGGLIMVGRTAKGRYSMDLALLYVPVFGKLVRKLMISRFARLLASLMDAGIPIVKALEINANAVGNSVYKRRIEFASQDVAQGIQLGENLTGNDFLFPPMVSSMVLVGEQTANLSQVATKIADFYEGEVDTAVASLSKLMEPLILVVMGSIVGFIVAAVMQPIMALSDISSVI